MTISKAIAAIIGCTLLFAAGGAGLGYALGTLAPGYYRGVFRTGGEPGFDPVDVGVGLGVTQGTALGVVVGLVLVALFCWRELRLGRSAEAKTQPEQPLTSSRDAASRDDPPPAVRESGTGRPTNQHVARFILLIVGAMLLVFCSGSISYVVGLIYGATDAYHLRCLEEQEILALVLASDPAFGRVECGQSERGVRLFGRVPTQADADRLRTVVARTLGEARAKSSVLVSVQNGDEAAP